MRRHLPLSRLPWTTDAPLRPFRGELTPGLCFASGHCVVVVDFRETPTRHGAYREAWLVAPDGTRTLVCSDRGAIPGVERYHEFDRTAAGDVVLARNGGALALAVRSDAFDLELEASLGATKGTRLASTVGTLTPGFLLGAPRVGAAAGRATRRLLGVDLPAVGETETGARYRMATKGVRAMTDASARLDGEDLGDLAPPARRVAFGDIVVPDRALWLRGTLSLPHP